MLNETFSVIFKHRVVVLQIAGGKGYFAVYDSNEPVVAICQGCTGQAADVPTTTPNTAKTTTPITAKTTTKPDVTTTKPVTVTPNEDCCQEITLSSSGGVQEHYGEALGMDLIKLSTLG